MMADPFIRALVAVEKAARAVLPATDMTAHEVPARMKELRKALADLDKLREEAKLRPLRPRAALTAADYKCVSE